MRLSLSNDVLTHEVGEQLRLLDTEQVGAVGQDAQPGDGDRPTGADE